MDEKKKLKEYIIKTFYRYNKISNRINALKGYHTKFGKGDFYQSFPLLEIEGQRPTDYRIEQYGVKNELDPSKSVLDIGCNIGFFDISLSEYARCIDGIEYNRLLVKLGNKICKKLHINNVRFSQADFKKWVKRNTNKYDVVFSFAVHLWIGMEIEDYCKALYGLLSEGGRLFFESQKINQFDPQFDDYVNNLVKLGLRIVREGRIKDDGVIERRWLLFEK